MRKIVFGMFCLALFSSFVFSQTVTDWKTEAERVRKETAIQDQQRQMQRIEAIRANNNQRMRDSLAKIPTENKNSVTKRPILIEELNQEKYLSSEDRAKITPEREYYEKYAKFLAQKETGLVKILLDPKCGNSMVVDINAPKCSNVFPLKGNGAYYSFRLGSHADTPAADIYYADDKFQVGFKPQLLGFLVDLGDTEIESLDKKDYRVEILRKFNIPKNFEKLEALKSDLRDGLKIEGLTFFDNLEFELDTTYLIRTVAYQYEEQAENDKRIDAILVFRVVSQDDKSVTILWKGIIWKQSGLLNMK